MSDIRQYTVSAGSTDTFGRVMCSARNHHVVIDGPIENGCPGEAMTPGEMFLASVAACGVELVQVIAKQENVAVGDVRVKVWGMIDRANPVRPDKMVFNKVTLDFELSGVDREKAMQLVESFKGR